MTAAHITVLAVLVLFIVPTLPCPSALATRLGAPSSCPAFVGLFVTPSATLP